MVRDKEKSVCAIGYRFDHRFRPEIYIYIYVKVRETSSILRHVKFLAESIFKFCIKYKRKSRCYIYIYIYTVLKNNRVMRHGGNRPDNFEKNFSFSPSPLFHPSSFVRKQYSFSNNSEQLLRSFRVGKNAVTPPFL